MGWYYSQLFVTPEYPTNSFSGQIVIVTGSNTGLGLEAARHFARLGAEKVILAVRNVEAGEKAKKSIEASVKRSNICEVWKLDLSSFKSVKSFAIQASKLARLDVVIENAAIATPHFDLSEDHERSITVNVISTMLLGLLILPMLKDTANKFPNSTPHLTIVSSEVHAWTQFAEGQSDDVFGALNKKESGNMNERYSTSKLLEIFAVRQLAPRVSGSGIVVNMLNPGLCHSELARESGWDLALFKILFGRSTEVGSRTLVAGAAAGPESHGAYMSDGKVADNALSAFVKSKYGAEVQDKVWHQLGKILESIEPGIMSSF